MDRIWVAIADDSKTFKSPVQIFDRSKEIIIMPEAESGQVAVEIVKQHRPVVLLIGSSIAGFEATRVITKKYPETIVIILAMQDSPEHCEKAVSTGAAGFITKDTSPPGMIRTIRTAVLTA